MNISETCIRRPVFATVLSLLLVLFGLVAVQRLAVREYPDINRPVVSITTIYRGASAAVVENKITQAIEDRAEGIAARLVLAREDQDRQLGVGPHEARDRRQDELHHREGGGRGRSERVAEIAL